MDRPLRVCFLFGALAFLTGGAGAAPATLAVPVYERRASERFSARSGVPLGKVLRVSITAGNTVVSFETETGLAAYDGRHWSFQKQERAEPFPFVNRRRLRPEAHLLSAAREPDGRVWAVTDSGLYRSRGAEYVPVQVPTTVPRHQRPASPDARFSCVAVDSAGIVWLGSNAGIFATDGADWWNVIDREEDLPFEDVTCLYPAPDGDLWAGTTEGVCRRHRGKWQYFWGPRWLPNNHVNAIGPDPSRGVWIATDDGAAHLTDELTTLEEAAEHYEAITDARHSRGGYVTGARLKRPGDPDAGVVPEASDNDGLWTGLYVAAESFRFAATREPEARDAARKSLHALLDLVRYTGVSGFPARAIIHVGETVNGFDPEEMIRTRGRIRGAKEKIWFRSPVDPHVFCKGDTSSDELDGHYFAWQVYYDLVADAAEKQEIRATVRAVTDNILQHDLTLVGPSGQRTRWGVWAPRFLNDDPDWWEERGLNSLEVLTYLKVADHICGDRRFDEKYRDLIRKHHYLLNTVTQKIEAPWWDVNHSDDEMAFMMYYSLLTLEHEPAVRRVLLQSLERSWQIERPEASPLFNFVYGACTENACDLEASTAALQEWPRELVDWEARGTQRHDVTLRTHTGSGRAHTELTRVLPPNERVLLRWNGDPYEADGGSPDGKYEEDGTAWLLPYWMGRYHGMIAPSPAAEKARKN